MCIKSSESSRQKVEGRISPASRPTLSNDLERELEREVESLQSGAKREWVIPPQSVSVGDYKLCLLFGKDLIMEPSAVDSADGDDMLPVG